MKNLLFLLLTLPLFSISAHEKTLNVTMNLVSAEGIGKSLGEVRIEESEYGLVFTPNLKGVMPSGLHGFHIHENPSCQPKIKNGKSIAGLGAGGHYDPHHTKKHGLPWGDGHLGDLPALYADDKGHATNPVLTPRIKKLSTIQGRALMIHLGGDNHSDHPKKLGGGGARIVCGVIR